MGKKRFSKFVKIISGLAVCGLFWGATTSANAYTLIGYRWKSSYLYVDTSLISGTAQTQVNNVLADYRSATNVTVLPSEATTSMVRVREGNWGASGWEGLTSVSYSGGFIAGSMSQLNLYYLPSNAPAAQRQVVWAHELGHALGLNHTQMGVNHIMYSYATAAYQAGIRKLTTDDINGINYLY